MTHREREKKKEIIFCGKKKNDERDETKMATRNLSRGLSASLENLLLVARDGSSRKISP